MTTIDIFEQRGFPLADNTNIPESNDNIPDLLNEAQWGIDWMLKMQKEDGGVFNKLASEIWESGSPENSDLGGQNVRYFMERTTHDTATAGAVFAAAARVWDKYNSTLSELLLSKARLAWSFLTTHSTATPERGFVNPPGVNFWLISLFIFIRIFAVGHISGPYYDVNDADNRAWIAAELYRTTCEVFFGDYYVKYIKDEGNVVAIGGNDFIDYNIEAAWAFYYSSCSGESAEYRTTRALILKAIRASATGNLGRTMGNTYNNVGRTDVPGTI